ncbi:kinase-like protein [Panus rudis PR-1116 ss-1]|nr:kinase-like protein [Panus rudis PR-1116 ss-1]
MRMGPIRNYTASFFRWYPGIQCGAKSVSSPSRSADDSGVVWMRIRAALESVNEPVLPPDLSCINTIDDARAYVQTKPPQEVSDVMDLVCTKLVRDAHGEEPSDQDLQLRRLLKQLARLSGHVPNKMKVPDIVLQSFHPILLSGFADIYKGTLDGKPVALKRLRMYAKNPDDAVKQIYYRETITWFTLRHPHILPLFGVGCDLFKGIGLPPLVLPWIERGNMPQYMHVLESNHQKVPLQRWLREIVEALTYLHMKQVTHGDIRGANVLIDKDDSALLTDFGMAKFADVNAMTENSNRSEGASRWLPPELLPLEYTDVPARPTPKADVYSFGCLWLELHTRRPPYPDSREGAAIVAKVIRGIQPGWTAYGLLPPHTVEELEATDVWQFVRTCFAVNPDDRPCTQELLRASEFDSYWIRESYQPPEKGKQY